jgi:hypothetical protein
MSASDYQGLDFNHMKLMLHLLRWDYRRAAVGLIQDLLKELHDAEETEREKRAAGTCTVMLDGTTLEANLVATYRERLMSILADPDGDMLKTWQDAYAAYRYGEKDGEWEDIKRAKFLELAMRYVVIMGDKVKAAALAEEGEDEDDSEEDQP